MHPLVTQLHFARSEFVRSLAGISDEDARTAYRTDELYHLEHRPPGQP